MTDNLVIPIFPLPVVVLPGEHMQLHIYEERYKLMIANCMTGPRISDLGAFGISFIAGNKLAQMGCLVTISVVIHEYEDGQMDILTIGRRRYHLRHKYNEFAYLTGAVDWVDDEIEAIESYLYNKVEMLYHQFCEVLGQEPEDTGPLPYSFQIGHQVGLETSDKQRLLEMTSENERLMMLYDHLHMIVPKIRETKEFNRRVRSNGHF